MIRVLRRLDSSPGLRKHAGAPPGSATASLVLRQEGAARSSDDQVGRHLSKAVVVRTSKYTDASPRRLVRPLRPQRGRAHPATTATRVGTRIFGAGRPRAAREGLHEDRFARDRRWCDMPAHIRKDDDGHHHGSGDSQGSRPAKVMKRHPQEGPAWSCTGPGSTWDHQEPAPDPHQRRRAGASTIEALVPHLERGARSSDGPRHTRAVRGEEGRLEGTAWRPGAARSIGTVSRGPARTRS